MFRCRPLSVALAAAAIVGSLSGCGLRGGFGSEGKQRGTADALGGVYLVFPHDLTYQVQVSRFLNPLDVEDQSYLKGLPPGTAPLAPGESWFAIFIRVSNETKQAHLSASDFRIVDTQNETFNPIPLDAGINTFAYQQQTLAPAGVLPVPSSVAADNVIQGTELLFRVNRAFFYNRPVVLEIHSPVDPALTRTIELDI